MVFSSALFVFYFLPLFLAGYFVLPRRWRNGYTAFVSLLFYAWGAPKFLGIFLLSCLLDYLFAARIAREERAQPRRLLVLLSTVCNTGLLLYFKYANFFVGQVSSLLSFFGAHGISWHTVALPIGISFFTFHKISYVVDVYRRTSPPARGFGEYLLYITFFPQLIAGPIVRYHEIETQIRNRSVTAELFFEGVWRFVVGLAAKLLFADPLGAVADHVFKIEPLKLTPLYAWLGTVAYTLQIYFDFAGYSSMAVGLAMLVGFRFPENFNRPYLATSVTEFWRRWHISLSRWMRDYLYIPLGGNRVSPLRQRINLWTVFLLSGFWHGASWNFLLWGAYHGFFLAIEKSLTSERFHRLPVVFRRAATLLVVMFGWVLFRSETASEAFQRILVLLGNPGSVAPAPLAIARASIISDAALALLLGAIVWCLVVEPLLERLPQRQPLLFRYPILAPAVVVLFFLSVLLMENGRYSPFIYFQF